MELEFTAPWESKSLVYYTFSGADGNMEILWRYKGRGNFIMNQMVSSMLSKKDLSNLKQLCEQN